MSEIKKMDRKTRKMLTIERMNHPKADVERIYLPRQVGGRGLTQLELAYKTTTMGLNVYLEQTEDKLLKLVHKHVNNKKLYSVSKDASKIKSKSEVHNLSRNDSEPITKFAKRIKQETKENLQKKMRQTWEEKPIYGQYPTRVNKPDVDQEKTHQWLRSSGLKSETEGLWQHRIRAWQKDLTTI